MMTVWAIVFILFDVVVNNCAEGSQTQPGVNENNNKFKH